MTEAAIPSGGADTPAPEPTGAPIEGAVDQPQALGSQTPVAEKPPEAVVDEKPKTAGDAVRKAMDKVKAEQAAKEAAKAESKPTEHPKDAKAAPEKAEPAKTEAKTDAKPEQKPAERGPDGKFLAKATEAPAEGAEAAPAQQQPAPTAEQAKGTIHEPPPRFDAAAKAEWANAPESVKGAVHRTIRELETGIEEHRARWEPIKQYDDLAKQYQTNLPDALERYVSMDKLLSQDLAQGVDSILRDKTGGQMGLREFVAQLTGQKPDEAASRSDATVHELRQEIAGLKQQLGGVSQHIQQQVHTSIEERVKAFATEHSDFDALQDSIAKHIESGKTLEAAYEAARQEAEELARSLGYVPATSSQPLSPAPQPPPLKPAGQKSVTGAPATGSDPASTTRNKAPATSIREALERARRAVA